MGPFVIVSDPPAVEDLAGVAERAEQMLVQALVAEPADEALRERVLHRLARRDVVPLDRMVLGPGEDRPRGALAKRIKAICETRVRYGYRRVRVLLRREGWDVNHKKVHGIYNELGLQLRNKTPNDLRPANSSRFG
jgi:transposase InsO family protein